MYRHILWDFDGTLFDTYPVMGGLFQRLLAEDGIEEPLEEIVRQMKISMLHAREHYRAKYRIDEAFLRRYEVLRSSEEPELCVSFAGAAELCRFIRASGRNNYLYTHRGESAVQLLERHGLLDCFADCITSQQGFARKPSPDAINYLVEKRNMPREQTLMVGDREVDILAGKNAGICACFFDADGGTCAAADHVVADLRELYSFL